MESKHDPHGETKKKEYMTRYDDAEAMPCKKMVDLRDRMDR